jgi:transcription antitermination factor NusG
LRSRHENFELALLPKTAYMKSALFVGLCKQSLANSSPRRRRRHGLKIPGIGTERGGALRENEWSDDITRAQEVSWYAVLTRSRQEKASAAALRSVGVTTFLPLVTETHRWSDRKQKVTVPLFPSYLFVQIPFGSDLKIRTLRTPGIVRFVGDHTGALAIRDEEIQYVQTLLSQERSYAPYPYLRLGQKVRIVGGALDGIEGTLIDKGPKTRLVISVELIQRSLAVSAYGLQVEPVSSERDVAA